jgi:hypothetical protein
LGHLDKFRLLKEDRPFNDTDTLSLLGRQPATKVMFGFFPILLILIAPVIGWRIDCLLRSSVAAGRPSQMSLGLLVGILPSATIAFICLEGVFRAALLAFLGLMVLFAHISAKRVAI